MRRILSCLIIGMRARSWMGEIGGRFVPPVHILDATLEEEAAIPLRLLLMFSFESAQPHVQGMRTLGNVYIDIIQQEGEKYARDMWQSLNAKLKDEELSRLKERNRF
ncbi:hypothetical protein CVT26_010061 [Gymnopilus dilepis]|uniref:Uncharacterized protein n=1 Tax=Gymnopilus dilepis TaxID=231916 RepID=A0A409VWL9_9AGAR|nr:hypothetical protein CVT26_010061 [Gymnopilus dilepis]